MDSVELAAAFDRAVDDRLIAAERFVLTLPELFRGSLQSCDLGYRLASRFFVVVVRVEPTAAVRGRLEFWAARAGGRFLALSTIQDRDRAAFYLYLEECDLKRIGVVPAALPDAVGQLVTEAGASELRKRPAPDVPVLMLDATGPGWEGVNWEPSGGKLFVPGAVTPPVGDELTVSIRLPGIHRQLNARARVASIRGPKEAVPGSPAGFTLVFGSPPQELVGALSKTVSVEVPRPQQRAAPRYPVKAPVKIAPLPPPEPSTARIEYATDQEMAADYLDNLSQGGAFVRTARPQPVGTRLTLEMQLPAGVELKAPATVAFVNASGMGVKFELDEEGQETLAGVIARISARPRRALVVDDDALVRRMLSDGLAERGFEVLSADDGQEGLRIIAEELLALDLLVTDVNMPGMDGEAFIRAIRKAGGEADLAIVAVTGRVDGALEARLESAGADAVLDKELGPALIAQAADAALERKRLVMGN